MTQTVPLAKMPGPTTWQSLLGLRRLRNDVLGLFRQRWRQYGDLYLVTLPQRRLVVASHPDLAYEVLVTGRNEYERIERPNGEKFGLALALGDGLLTTDGAQWQKQRRMIQPMFHRKRIEDMAATMVAAGRDMCSRLEAAAATGAVVDLYEETKLVTLDIINRTMFSANVMPEVQRVGSSVDVALEFIAHRERRLRPTPLHWPTPRNRRFRDAMGDLDGYLYRLIGERRATGTRNADLLDMLIEVRDPETGAAMSDRQIRDEIATIYGAGHETTANALAWAWYALGDNPAVLERLRAEADAVLGDRDPELGDLESLPFARMVFEESLRMYPPVPMTGRMGTAGATLRGYAVPAWVVVVIVIDNIHRHPDFWERPDVFEPERFGEERRRGRHRMAFMPFGGGPHLCVGNHFAMIEGQLLLTMMAQRFGFTPRYTPPVEGEVNITMRPRGGLPVTVAPRSRR